MSEKQKERLERIAENLNVMDEAQQERVLAYTDGAAMMAAMKNKEGRNETE